MIALLQKLYTDRPGNNHTDLCAMVATLSNVQFEEVQLSQADANQLFAKVGTGATLPILEVEGGQLISQTSAIN